MPTYREQQKSKYQQKIEEMITQMPDAVYRYVMATESSVSPHTMYEYLQAIHRFLVFLHDHNPALRVKKITEITNDDLNALTADDVDEFLSSVYHRNLNDFRPERAAKTRNHYLSSLRSFFAFLYSRDLVDRNIIDKIRRSSVPKKQTVVKLNREEEEKMLETMESGNGLTDRQLMIREGNDLMNIRDKTIVMLLLRTGLRVSELVGLNEKDIIFSEHCLSVQRKREKPDIVFLDDDTEQLLSDYLEYKRGLSFEKDPDAVFIVTVGKYKGKRLSVRSVQMLVKKYAVAGVPTAGSAITPHRLRATFATDLLRASDNNLKLVQEAMAHESVSTTMVYLGNDTQNKKENRNLLKRENKLPESAVSNKEDPDLNQAGQK